MVPIYKMCLNPKLVLQCNKGFPESIRLFPKSPQVYLATLGTKVYPDCNGWKGWP